MLLLFSVDGSSVHSPKHMDSLYTDDSGAPVVVVTGALPPAPNKLNRLRSYMHSPSEIAKYNVVRFKKFRQRSSFYIFRVLGYLFSFDIGFFKLLVGMGATVFDKEQYNKSGLSYYNALQEMSEKEWKEWMREWSSLVLELPRCGWVYKYGQWNLQCSSNFFQTALLSPIMSIRRYFQFLKAGFGFWDDDSLTVLIQTKIDKFELDNLIEDGYADELMASVMRPRAALLRIYPYFAPMSLFMQQVG